MNIANAQTMEIDGFPLRYAIKGQGMPMLIIGSSLYDQRNYSKELEKEFQLIFLDHRGFVKPTSEENLIKNFGLEVILKDIELVRKHLNLEKFIICGHSGHSFMALEYAKQHRDKVLGVVLIGAAPSNSDARRTECFEYFTKHASPERREKFFKEWSTVEGRIAQSPESRFAIMVLASGAQSWYDYNFDATPMWQDVYTNMPVIDHLWGVVFRDIDITTGLSDFETPVLLALGEHDYLTGLPHLWNDVKSKFNDIQIQVFKESGHNPHYEEAARFNEALIEWNRNVVGDRGRRQTARTANGCD
jgi:proline iminopeptidase